MLTTDTDLPPERKIVKARIAVIRRDPFFGGIAARLKLKELTKAQARKLRTKTLATDGRYLYYYPPGIAAEPFTKFVTIIAHEGGHVAFKHPLRRGNRNFRLWNRACDIVVNNILRKAGYEMPDHGTYRHDLDGMSAEKVYAILKKEIEDKREQMRQQMQQMMQQLQQQAGDTDDQDEGDDELEGDEDEPETDQQDDEDDWEDEDDQDDQDGPEMEDVDDWEDEFNQDLDPDAEGDFQIDPDLLEDDDEIDELPDIPDLPDELMDGVVLDAPEDLMDTDGEQELDLGIEAAFNSAKSAGLVPGGTEILIETQRQHKIDYRDLLRDWLDMNLFVGDYSWKKPNRRYLQHEIILPGLTTEENLPNIGFVCDTSISVNEQELRVYSREISGVLEEFPCSFDVIYCDTDVRHAQHFETDDLPIVLEAYGRGGTKFTPAFKYLRENYPDIDAIMYFTDMGAWDWAELANNDPGIPVLWMNTDRTEDDRQVPFGTIVPLEIDSDD